MAKKPEITYNEETGLYETVRHKTKGGCKLILSAESEELLREVLAPKLKGKFTARWLMDSNPYYSPLFQRWSEAESKYFKRNKVVEHPEPLFTAETEEDIFKPEMLAQIEAYGVESRASTLRLVGFSEIHFISESIHSLNRGFAVLLEAAEPLAAMALVRLQLDNLTYLAAEIKYPFRILYKVYFKNKRLSQIQVQGKNLNPAAIRKELDELKGWNLTELYDVYSSYIHPDHNQLSMRKFIFMKSSLLHSQMHFSKAEMNRLTKDMVTVNRMIAELIQDRTAELKAK